MEVGDIVVPILSRFPAFGRDGKPLDIRDDCLGQSAIITKEYRFNIEVRFLKTGVTWIYRKDEVVLVQIRDL